MYTPPPTDAAMSPYDATMVSLAIVAIIIILIIIIVCIDRWLKSPFSYPHLDVAFDVSRKRQPKIEDYIDRWLLDGGWDEVVAHSVKVSRWKDAACDYIDTHALKKRRTRQLAHAIDDAHAYRFTMTRKQTRYTQKNYVRTPYQVTVVELVYRVDRAWLADRWRQLLEIGGEATLSEYHAKNQRSLMTRELRKEIMERDDYTCQKCGKHMPDEVGLHIDHIVPVSKGGKSVPSNLQVLCDKCNASKGSR